ncbi:putative gamma-glutamyl hydrolase-like isoform X3 [Apostichopus japonicus]|uniref:folate gamma-glutamyl hydrolase n=1 Tax=Stichopus japonicus TaxID=307972 RepID=A0A2G8L888_STIJA|nr:putative gamma-glutamyl hydrolase-like isoform X3 [Apostichopus japonicus]
MTRVQEHLGRIVFPGGGTKVFGTQTGIGRSAAYMFEYAKESFDKGDYFVVYGICFGFELLAMLRDDFSCLTTNLSASDISLPLNFTQGYEKSRMFGKAPEDIISILSTQNVTFNAHRKGVTTTTFNQNHKLNSFYQDLSTNKDKNGQEFISSMEAYEYPIYGTQWHPEKNPFEWNMHSEKNIPHSGDAVKVSQYMAEFIVSEARKSNHSFSSQEEEQKALIYNYQPFYTGDIYIMEQCYVFK